MPRERGRPGSPLGPGRAPATTSSAPRTPSSVVLDLDASERFYVDLLGLVVSERTGDALYLRGWEERSHHSLVLREARRRRRARGCRSACAASTTSTRSPPTSSARGCERASVDGRTPGHGPRAARRDPFGFPLAFFAEMSQFDTQLQRFDIQRGAPIARIDHFNLHSPDVRGDVRASGSRSASAAPSTSRPTARTSASPAPGSRASRPCTTSR